MRVLLLLAIAFAGCIGHTETVVETDVETGVTTTTSARFNLWSGANCTLCETGCELVKSVSRDSAVRYYIRLVYSGERPAGIEVVGLVVDSQLTVFKSPKVQAQSAPYGRFFETVTLGVSAEYLRKIAGCKQLRYWLTGSKRISHTASDEALDRFRTFVDSELTLRP